MGDGRTLNRNLDDFSKAVATLQDILFKPSDEIGHKFLNYRSQIIEAHKTSWWAQHYQPSQVLSEEEELVYLVELNPAEWKDQDHYAVLGLGHLRIRATEEDIRKAYRQRCLKHHPDKRMAAGQFIANPDGDYFACIVKAFEILGSPKRRSYDSIDSKFDDYIPPKNMKEPSQFFKVYGRWFFLNSQWSNKEPVPLLGDMFTPRRDVEKFYDFWYNFDSWREYSYLDEEDKEKGADRDERRWIDKQNKAVRAKLKKEEMARIRQVVDNAYTCDPRVAFYKSEDLRKKTEIKEAKRKAHQQKQQEEQKARRDAEEKERILKEKEDAETREREIKLKREKDVLKKALKKERKTLRTVVQEHNYFGDDTKVQVKIMSHLEHLCEVLSLSDLEILNQKIVDLNTDEAAKIFWAAVRKHTNDKTNLVPPPSAIQPQQPLLIEPKSDSNIREWTVEEQKLLEQGLKTFPATDSERWTHIAECIPGRTKKECMTRFKELAAIVKAKKAQTSQSKSKLL